MCSTLALAALALLATPADGPPITVRGEVGQRIDRHLTRLERLGFSGAVLVAREGELVLAKGYGLADRERGVPVDVETVFPMGSISKHFTAAAVLRLASDGLLALDDPIERHLEGVPEDKRAITVHQLLTHTSGLPAAGPSILDDSSREGFVRGVLAQQLAFHPGQGVEYSNLGFGLLAAIVERATGEGFERVLRDLLFEPAGMTSTGLELPRWEPRRLAHGRVDGRDVGTYLEQGPATSWAVRGSGGLQTTVGDMARWNDALDRGLVLDAEALELMATPHVALGDGFAGGYGCGVARTPHGTMVGHDGSDDVFSADFRRYVDARALIFAAGNDADVYVFDVTPAIERLLFGEDVEPPPETIDLAPAELARYAGAWRLEGGGSVEVEADDGVLAVGSSDAGAAALLHPLPPGAHARRAELAGRLERAYTAAFEGELEPLRELIDPYAPPAAFAERQAARLDALTGELGAFRGARAVPGRNRFGEIALVAALVFEDGERRIEYCFGPREVGSIRLLEAFPTRVVRPESRASFVAWDAAAGEGWRVRFQLDGDELPVALLLTDGAGAERVARREP